MIRLLLVNTVLQLCLRQSVSALNASQSPERILRQDLLTDYDTSARPVVDPTQTVEVQLGFTLQQILEFDSALQILSVSAYELLSWNDPYLTWSPEDYQNITKLVLPSSALWVPDIANINSIDNVLPKDKIETTNAIVSSDGSVVWYPGGAYNSICEVDITYFPFDYQKCVLNFSSWSYDQSRLSLSPADTIIGLYVYKENGEWSIISTEATCDCIIEDGYFDTVNFVLHLQRRSSYYVVNIILPIILLSLLELCVFWLPPESGEKNTLAITIMLGFSVFAFVITAHIPTTSTSSPVIVSIIMVSMALAAISVAGTVVVLVLHDKKDDSKNSAVSPSNDANESRTRESSDVSNTDTDTRPLEMSDLPSLAVIKKVPHSVSDAPYGEDTPGRRGCKYLPTQLVTICMGDRNSAELVNHRRSPTDWKQVSRVIDKIFFCITCVILVILLIVAVAKVKEASPK